MKKIIALILSLILITAPLTAAACSEDNSESIRSVFTMKERKIKRSDIHPDIRSVGNIIRFILPSMNPGFFKLANFFMDTFGLPDLTKNINREEIYILREDGSNLRLCVYSPKKPSEGVPGLLWIHGGGYALGCPEQDFSFIQSFVDATGCVVVAPDYINSPTAPYPAAFDDCYNSLLWLRDNAQSYGINQEKLFVGGNSAGGGLCAAVTLKARDTGDVNIAFQMPLYPMLDNTMSTQSMKGNDAPIWNEKSNENAWRLYLGEDFRSSSVSKYASPARETDFSGLPPTLTYIGTIDPFYDETCTYVENLRAAGVKVEFKTFEGCFHGFDLLSYASVARDARNFLTEGFIYAAENYSAPQNQ